MLLDAPAQLENNQAQDDVLFRRDLVERIVSSSQFSKSQRLSEFLRYVCVLAEKRKFDDINEQGIGSAVFGRSRDYDPSIDSIVRSHASRLRHRLREYFEREGVDEPLILTIPRGSYIPRFELRSMVSADAHRESSPSSTAEADQAPSNDIPLDITHSSVEPLMDAEDHFSSVTMNGIEMSQRRTIGRLKIALATTVIVAVVLPASLMLKGMLLLRRHDPALLNQHPLWGQFAVPSGSTTLIVSSDSGLVMLQHLTTHPVALSSYVSGEYLKQVSSASVSEVIVRKLGMRRYTPAADLYFLDRIMRLFGDKSDRLFFRYARDLRLEELKRGNAILLGTAESNPWVELFEQSMNFYFQDDLANDKSQLLNRHPQPGEQLHYDSAPQNPAPTIYGVVAYRPNLSGAGNVLILEGQTMAGTQAAADFALDDSYLLPFLKKIRRSDGTVPHFEILLRSSSVGGQSSRLETVAYRVEMD